MSESEGLSRSELRAELAELELRLSRLFADRSSFVSLEQRVTSLEVSRHQREHLQPEVQELLNRVDSLESESIGGKAVSRYRAWLVTGVIGTFLATTSILIQYIRAF